jgi:hypothetical protein
VVDNIPGRITFTPINSANSSGQILGYTILIKAGFPTPRLNWTNYSSLPPSDPNAMLFKISIQGTNGTMTNTSYLSKTAFSQVQLLNPANSSLATLRIGPPANVTLFYATPFSVEIIMALNSSSSVELGANIINATMSDGLRSSSKVILGES